MAITFKASCSGRQQLSRALIVSAAWATAAPDHSVSDTILLSGLLHGVLTTPGTPAPSDGYNVELLDAGGVDVLRGVVSDCDSDVSQLTETLVGSVLPVPLDGQYVLRVSEADSDTAGTVKLLLAT